MTARSKLSSLSSDMPLATRSRPVSSAAKSASKPPSRSASTTFVTKPVKPAAKAGKPVGKRERIDTTPGKTGGSRYVRRDSQGQFTEDQVSVGKSLAADRRTKATTKATKGNKDRGD
jgi:hypothetical protein